ncbi:MAG TPA: hypothetical protein VHH73_18795 [Verrucomicrobiae bacterium]|nr:hypothetical protein [Verrucomicrobiae bacterium]
MKTATLWMTLLLALTTALHLRADTEVAFTAGTTIAFASVETAQGILTNRDEFIRALSPFDRAARLKTDREVTEAEFLAFVAKQAREWTPEDLAHATNALGIAAKRLAPRNLPLPKRITLVKTSGREEGNASYTRGTAILLPAHELEGSVAGLESVLIHEFFHVLSRANSDLRAKLYAIIGFSAGNEIDYPAELLLRKITNPDGVSVRWSINVTNQGRAFRVTPILYATVEKYPVAKGGEFFEYLNFKLLEIESVKDRWVPRLRDGQSLLHDAKELPGYFDQIGRNTDYIIHPDEILASNFVFLMTGKAGLPSPRVTDEMAGILRGK